MEEIKGIRIVLSIIIISTMMLPGIGIGQNTCDFYIESLKKELFQEDCDSISIYDIIKKTDDRHGYNVDSYQLDSTKYVLDCQPDADVVLEYLDSLMMMGDLACYTELTEIYERQLDLFLLQWEQCYMDNYYAPTLVLDQFSILTGFEMVIRSLNFKKEQYTDQQIFDYYIEEVIVWDSIFNNLKLRCDIVKKYDRYYSDKFKKLNPCSLFRVGPGFDYLDPYKSRIKDYFIELLYTCDIKKWGSKDFNCRKVFISRKLIYQYNDQRIANYFIDNFEYLLHSKRVGLALNYAGMHDNSVLSHFILDHFDEILEKHPEIANEFTGSFSLFIPKRKDYNLRLFIDKVIEIGETDPAKSKKYYSLLSPKRAKPILEEKKRVIDSLLKKEQ